VFSKIQKYSWKKQENTEQDEPGAYGSLYTGLRAYSLSNHIQWKRLLIILMGVDHIQFSIDYPAEIWQLRPAATTKGYFFTTKTPVRNLEMALADWYSISGMH